MQKLTPAVDPTFRKGQCEFFTWDWEIGAELPVENLQEYGNEAKRHLFRELLPAHEKQLERGRQTLKRLREIHPVAASLFCAKPYLVDGMILRLIRSEEVTEIPKNFTALSYSWRAAADTPSPGMRSVPISPLLFQHLMLQRETADEGVWCDQLCIDQSNKDEKNRTITAMDAIYSSARVVIVAIDDVQVSIEEEKFLRAFIKDYEDKKHPLLPPPYVHDRPPYMDLHPILKDFFVKICSSRWFQRAWCAHEMRMAKRHRFLIPCESSPRTLLSFSDFFMAYMVLLSASVMLPDDESRVRDVLNHVFEFARYIDDVRRILGKAPPKGEGEEQQTSAWTTIISEMFKLGSGGDPEAVDREKDANLDRMTIVLNSVESGLALKRFAAARSSRAGSDDLCQVLLFTVSLAAGDPTALTTNGKPFQLGDDGHISWLRQPHHTDIGSGARRQQTLPVMEPFYAKLDTSPAFKWIELDFFVSNSLEEPSTDLRELASLIVMECRKAGLGGGFMGQAAQGPSYLGWRMETDFEFWNTNFTGIIAIFLSFGPKWVLGVAEKCGFASPMVLKEIKSSIQTHFADGFDQAWLKSLEWTKSKVTLEAVNAVLRVAYWSVAWSMSIMPQTHPDRWAWKPYTCFASHGLKAMIISPENMVAAIPSSLMRAGYDRLPRTWLLKAAGSVKGIASSPAAGLKDTIAIEGKSILFANLSKGDYSRLRDGASTIRIRVHGPQPKPPTSDSQN